MTVGATSLRALTGSGTSSMSGALAGTAERLLAFLDYFAGVFTLLSLTAAVVCGLAATDRLVLSPRQRVAMQSVHRATSVAALGFLVTHITVKVMEQDASPLTVLLPFGGGATFAVGLGTVAADLLVLTAATGAVRGRFAGSKRPWLWRVLHAGAYACWPIALAHGLTAGRAAAVWVLWSYGLCAAAVGLALLIRVLAAAGRGDARRRMTRTLLAYEAGDARGTEAEAPATTRRAEPARASRRTRADAAAPADPIPYAAFADAADADSALTSTAVGLSFTDADLAAVGAAQADPGDPRFDPRFAGTGAPTGGYAPAGGAAGDARYSSAGYGGANYGGDGYGPGAPTAQQAMPQPSMAQYAMPQGPMPQQSPMAQPTMQQPAMQQQSMQPSSVPQQSMQQYPFAPEPGASFGYGYPAPSPWAGDGEARQHPALAETPPHGFAVPGLTVPGFAVPGMAMPGFAVPAQAMPAHMQAQAMQAQAQAQAMQGQAGPGQAMTGAEVPGGLFGARYAEAGNSGWRDDSAEWGALTWDTPANGIPVAQAAPGWGGGGYGW
ncbi:hypothetical protein [Streptacidiphilus sp. EB129]|uniref:hypothetical protein n=1 Tax=Streptacidiphilus sp. EB129 TaxID=3156262 RepID=UPI0035198DC4